MRSRKDLNRSNYVRVRVRPAERQLIDLAAENAGQRLSEFVRAAVLRKARAVVAGGVVGTGRS